MWHIEINNFPGTFVLRLRPEFKELQSLEVCGGLITDAGVKNIRDLSSLTHLNLSQNSGLTDRTLQLISGIRLDPRTFPPPPALSFLSHPLCQRPGLTGLVSLNLSGTRITDAGLGHLRPLKLLRSLHLDACRVTVPEMKKLQLSALPNLVSIRPE